MWTVLLSLTLSQAATWDCTQVAPVAPNNVRSMVIQGTQRVPAAARVTNEWTGTVMAQNRQLTPRPGYQGGYWLQAEGLDAYAVGDFGGVRYVLLVPHGVLGARFTAQEHENFQAGGSIQNLYTCVQR